MPHKEKRLKDAKVAAEEADFRVLRIMVGWHDTEGYASLHPPATSHSLRSGIRPFRSCGGYRGIEGIQPERLNAEGNSPSALSRGLSDSATPGIYAP